MYLNWDDFVREYVKYEVLINPKSPHYNNEEQKNIAIESLRKTLNLQSVNEVNAKILTVQTLYTRAIVKQQNSGQPPTLSWFHILDRAIKNPDSVKEGKWSDGDFLDLIREVVKRPRLWNLKFIENEAKLRSDFQEIADLMKSEMNVIVKNWNSLVSNYKEEKDKLSMSIGIQKSTWFAFERLSFLDINEFITSKSIKSTCRSCYCQSSEIFYDAFLTKVSDELTLSEVFFKLTRIRLLEEDQYPVNFCENCLLHLTELVKFEERALLTDKELRISFDEAKNRVQVKKKNESTEDNTIKIIELKDLVMDDQNEIESIDNSNNKSISSDNFIEIIEEINLENEDIIEMVVDNADFDNGILLEDNPTSVSENNVSQIDEGRKFKCEKCPMAFKTVGILKQHHRIHTREYLCDLCGKNFSHQSNLNMHYRNHTNERPFDCKVCGFAFKQYCTLRDHMTLHTGKKFKCTECDKVFYRPLELKRHFMVHTGERPYGCDICGSRYTRTSQLNMHIKIAHQGHRFNCEVCDREFRTRAQVNYHLKMKHKIVKSKPYEPQGEKNV